MSRLTHDVYSAVSRNIFRQRFRDFYVEYNLGTRSFVQNQTREQYHVTVRPNNRPLFIGEAEPVAVAVEGHSDIAAVPLCLRARVFHHGRTVGIRSVVRVGRVYLGIVFNDLTSRGPQKFWREEARRAVAGVDQYLYRPRDAGSRDEVRNVGIRNAFLAYR